VEERTAASTKTREVIARQLTQSSSQTKRQQLLQQQQIMHPWQPNSKCRNLSMSLHFRKCTIVFQISLNFEKSLNDIH
jgi:hypothetical protein